MVSLAPQGKAQHPGEQRRCNQDRRGLTEHISRLIFLSDLRKSPFLQLAYFPKPRMLFAIELLCEEDFTADHGAQYSMFPPAKQQRCLDITTQPDLGPHAVPGSLPSEQSFLLPGPIWGPGVKETCIERISVCWPSSAWYSEVEESRNPNIYIRTDLGFNLGNIMQSFSAL